MSRDRIYALPREHIGNFAFDDAVAEVFPDMLARSVPGYASILSMIEQLAAKFVRPHTQVYDLGCSLGAATLLMRPQIPANCVIHAVDSSPAMICRLRTQLTPDVKSSSEEAEKSGKERELCEVRVHEADIRDMALSNASFVVLNFTLQFIPAADRDTLLASVWEALGNNGALLLSEKVCFDDEAQQELLTELHHDFKRAHGYSELEISQKRSAIENRLIPETIETHQQRLKAVGFERVTLWFQCFNFVSFLAVK